MVDFTRWDPEMRAARAQMDAEAAKYPPVLPIAPFDPQRLVNDKLSMLFGTGGPEMAHSADRFVFAHGRRVLCRLHRPLAGEDQRTRGQPLLVWLHGGGWVWASIDTHDRLVRELAAASGYAAVSVDYTLAPEARFPQAVFECAEAIRKIAADAEAWGIDPACIVVGGDSAGGNLALAVAIMLRDQGGPKLAGILAAYPVTDADFESPSYREFAEGYGLTRAGMMAYWDLYMRDPADRLNALAAPLRDSQRGLPPTLVQLAELDVLYSDGERLATKMTLAGGKVTLETYRGLLHGFLRFSAAVGQSRKAIASAGKWLKKLAG